MFTFEYMACCQVGAGFQVSRGWRKDQTKAWLAAVKEKKKKGSANCCSQLFFSPLLHPQPPRPKKGSACS